MHPNGSFLATPQNGDPGQFRTFARAPSMSLLNCQRPFGFPDCCHSTPALSRATPRRRLKRLVRRLSDCFPRTLLDVDRREGEVVDALHTFDMAQPLNEAGRQEDDREIPLGVDHPRR